jgi:hypothetical protein
MVLSTFPLPWGTVVIAQDKVGLMAANLNKLIEEWLVSLAYALLHMVLAESSLHCTMARWIDGKSQFFEQFLQSGKGRFAPSSSAFMGKTISIKASITFLCIKFTYHSCLFMETFQMSSKLSSYLVYFNLHNRPTISTFCTQPAKYKEHLQKLHENDVSFCRSSACFHGRWPKLAKQLLRSLL